MARRFPNLMQAAFLAGTALVIAACSLSTPSPAGGFRHDFTPRTVGPGLMATRLMVTRDIYFLDRIEDGVLLGHTFGIGEVSQLDVVAETRTLTISDHDSAGNAPGIAPGIHEEGYYLGGQYKSRFPDSDGGRFLMAYFAGAGLGAYGRYVKHVDAHAGASGGYNGNYFCPFAAAALGFSLPYSRQVFTHANQNVGGGFGPRERYRYATAGWLAYELGFESPFGNREKGFRLHMSWGQKIFQMLEKDIVSDHDGVMSPYGLDFQHKIGLAWTY